MILIICIGFYLVGCVLAYGRLYATDTGRRFSPSDKDRHAAWLSWIAFLIGCALYDRASEKFFQFRDPAKLQAKRELKPCELCHDVRRVKSLVTNAVSDCPWCVDVKPSRKRYEAKRLTMQEPVWNFTDGRDRTEMWKSWP